MLPLPHSSTATQDGKTVLDNIFEAFPEEITEAIIVVRYLGEKIKCTAAKHSTEEKSVRGGFGQRERVHFWPQTLYTRNERVMVLYADEIPSAENMRKGLAHEYRWLCKETLRPKSAGVVRFRDDGTIEEIVEKSENPPSTVAAIGLMVLSGEMFRYEPVQNPNGEYSLSSMANRFLKEHKVYAVITEGGCSLTKPEDIPKVETFLAKRKANETAV